MKLHFTILLTFLCASFMMAQTVVDFEDFEIEAESFLNGDDGSGGFSSGDLFLNNEYNTDFMSWSGWAISNTTDISTPGFMNQYSAIPGSGVNGSENYAVTFVFGNNNLVLQGDTAGQTVPGMYITNNTYAYLSMLDGDAFTKKFGGVTGDDPDFFLLTIKGYSDGTITTDSVDFYLADFRDTDNTQDYIVDEWTWVDLSSMGPVDSLSFALTSTDIGQFGMNTPAYFCIDDVFAENPISSTSQIYAEDLFDIFPNPTSDKIVISHSVNHPLDCYIFDVEGRQLMSAQLNTDHKEFNLKMLPAGNYVVIVKGEAVTSSKVLIKK